MKRIKARDQIIDEQRIEGESDKYQSTHNLYLLLLIFILGICIRYGS